MQDVLHTEYMVRGGEKQLKTTSAYIGSNETKRKETAHRAETWPKPGAVGLLLIPT